MTDVFCVPTAELNEQQIGKKGLLESEIDWEKPTEPDLGQPSEADKSLFAEAVKEIGSIIQAMNRNERARKDIAGWKRDILVKTRGGEFAILIDDGNISLKDGNLPSRTSLWYAMTLVLLLDGLSYRGAITDSVINKKLWISKNMEFNTIFKLDRMARSVARARKLAEDLMSL